MKQEWKSKCISAVRSKMSTLILNTFYYSKLHIYSLLLMVSVSSEYCLLIYAV